MAKKPAKRPPDVESHVYVKRTKAGRYARKGTL